MSDKRYPEEFKIEVVKQVVDRGHSLSSEAIRLGITTHQSDAQAEIRLLQKCSSELRLTGHIKKNRGILRQAVRQRYAFIRDNNRG